MFNYQYIAVILCFMLALNFQAHSQGFLHADGQAIVEGNGDTIILRGMGLGGWMLQEGYMLQTGGFANAQFEIRNKIEELIGEADTDLFYEAWLANHMRKIDVDSLKAWGFNSVRLPMHYNLYTLPIEEEPVAGAHTWLDKGFELTDSLISWCAQNEMYVFLDLHAAPGGQGYESAISDYDPSKPSLWESQANRDKTIALWKRLAERYVDEPWVGGYDLLNEVNWNMTNNAPLVNLYHQLTDSIRAVDQNHLIIIEGNWFANDFTGLTPPWDDNMAYGPHKYWSYNETSDIQWVLSIRDEHNVPLWFGESGENSNTWYTDAIRLFEGEGIGWAWWPLKKIESISGPLSIVKSPEYQSLLDYWNGTGSTPSAAFAKATLMQLTEDLKLENCTYQKDVIDAMIRQVQTDETVPYNTQTIPGVVYATDFDMGVQGSAYFDTDVATYQVSTGNFTAWNQGWAYRNDGVDIQAIDDDVSTNGFNVGWTATGEWMQYDVDVTESAIYDVYIRIASDSPDGKIRLSVDGADISNSTGLPNTGGWGSWQSLLVPDVVIMDTDKKLRVHIDQQGFNLSSLQFVEVGATTSVPTEFLSAVTVDQTTVQLNLNKPLEGPIPASPADFEIFVNGSAVSITDAVLNTANARIITFTVDHLFKSSETIRISYTGDQINALDGTVLNTFSLKPVQNTIAIIHPVPGNVEAEDYFFQLGTQLENTTDIGGGQNVGFLDVGDYLDYYINVAQDGFYKVFYRTAAQSETGAIQMQLIDDNGGATILHSVNFDPTGGWQTWETTSQFASLTAGKHHIRLLIKASQFNLNWFEFEFFGSSTEDLEDSFGMEVFPNPGEGQFYLHAALNDSRDVAIQIHNFLGQLVLAKSFQHVNVLQEIIDLSAFPDGNYYLSVRTDQGAIRTEKIVKIGY